MPAAPEIATDAVAAIDVRAERAGVTVLVVRRPRARQIEPGLLFERAVVLLARTWRRRRTSGRRRKHDREREGQGERLHDDGATVPESRRPCSRSANDKVAVRPRLDPCVTSRCMRGERMSKRRDRWLVLAWAVLAYLGF